MLPMPSPGSRRWLRWGLVAVVVLLVAAGGAVAFVLVHSPHNVSHPDVEFTAPTTTAAAAPPRRPRSTTSRGRGTATTPGARASSPAGNVPEPPLHVGWRFQDYALLEFPPVHLRTTLYLIDDDGSAKATRLERTGHKLWETKVGTLAAASPALGLDAGPAVPLGAVDERSRPRPPATGRFVALSMKTGRVVWSKVIPAGTESSPIVFGNAVYFGDQGGTVYSLNATTGHSNWTYHASAAVKGGPALVEGRPVLRRLLRARVRAERGHRPPGLGGQHQRRRLRLRLGQLLLDARGRVRARVHGQHRRPRVLVRGQDRPARVGHRHRRLRVRVGRGRRHAGARPDVYLGSYDGNFYAFNAKSGAIRWRHPAGGKISGSATIVGNVVYYSDLGTKTTAGLDVRTGRQVFSFPDGAFNPVVADDGAIYLSGYTMLYQMLPNRR